MPPPRKKRPPAGQSVPDAGTISAHRDALRRSSGAAGQKPPERGLKNSPRRSRRLCADCAQQGNGGYRVLDVVKYHTGHWAPARTEGIPGAKTVSGGAGGCVQAAPMGEWRAMGVSGAGKAPHWAPAGAEGMPGRKNSPRRAPEAVWMRDMGVTCPGRSV